MYVCKGVTGGRALDSNTREARLLVKHFSHFFPLSFFGRIICFGGGAMGYLIFSSAALITTARREEGGKDTARAYQGLISGRERSVKRASKDGQGVPAL
jgi:hypothetical protein